MAAANQAAEAKKVAALFAAAGLIVFLIFSFFCWLFWLLGHNMVDDQAAAAEKIVTLKLNLLVDRKRGVVLFTEADKDFVDFLFHILALPLGTLIGLSTKAGTVGSLGNLYGSVEGLDDAYYVQPLLGCSRTSVKDSLLKPAYPASSIRVPLLLPPRPEFTSMDGCSNEAKYYICSTGLSHYLSLSPTATCPDCCYPMDLPLTLVKAPQQNRSSASGAGSESGRAGIDGCGGGYVKGAVTYMVMDDLVVEPMPDIISSITLLKKFNVTDLSLLEEKIVDFGMDEGVALLKASLRSKTVLTDVFRAHIQGKAQLLATRRVPDPVQPVLKCGRIDGQRVG